MRLLSLGLVVLALASCTKQPEPTTVPAPKLEPNEARPDAPAQAVEFECGCETPDLYDEESPEHPRCLRRVGSSYRMRPSLLASLPLEAGIPTFAAHSQCGTFWVRRDGHAMPTQRYDNSADYFQDSAARYVLDGKYGYMNEKLEAIVAPLYEFAFPFRGGRGLVCFDCKSTAEGEHTSIKCRRCGAVDTNGKLVVEVKYPQQELPPFTSEWPSTR